MTRTSIPFFDLPTAKVLKKVADERVQTARGQYSATIPDLPGTGGEKRRFFRLTDTLDPGGSVTAQRRRPDGMNGYEDDTRFEEETIYDAAYGTVSGAANDIAECKWEAALKKWVIVGISCSG